MHSTIRKKSGLELVSGSMDKAQAHSQAVSHIQAILRDRHPVLGHAQEKRHSNMTQKKASKTRQLGLNSLKNVLKINPDKKTVVAEPAVTMEELAAATLPLGLIPPVIPEFKGITIGGAINGGALESSSHRYGQFNDTCLSYEIMLGNGEIITASPKNNADLYCGMPGSYGTLGFLLSAEIQLIPAAGCIELNCRKFSSIHETVSFLRNNSFDWMEAIILSGDKSLVIWGSQTADKTPSLKFSSYRDPWFYSYCGLKENFCETIAFQDYFFRHDRGAFWMGGYALNPSFFSRYFLHKAGIPSRPPHSLPKNPGPLFRSLFGRMFSSQSLYSRLHADNDWFETQFVIQDFTLPEEKAADFIDYVIKRWKIKPLWLCPIKSTTAPQIFSAHKQSKEGLVFNVGVYGMPFGAKGPEAVRELEQLAFELGGKKLLYSLNCMSENEFWSLYPKEAYCRLREKHHFNGASPTIIDKLIS